MEKRFIGVKELAIYLDIKVPTIYSWVCQGRIPRYKLGGRMLKFDVAEIDAWMKKFRQEANTKWEEVSG